VDEAVEVAAELDRAVPRLEREGDSPPVPEVGGEEAVAEAVGDLLAVQKPPGRGRARATNSSRSRSENPIACVSMMSPCPSTRRATSSQAKASWTSKVSCVTDLAGPAIEGMEDSRSKVQRNCASNIRPPRIV
jgi:hypothetical protein